MHARRFSESRTPEVYETPVFSRSPMLQQRRSTAKFESDPPGLLHRASDVGLGYSRAGGGGGGGGGLGGPGGMGILPSFASRLLRFSRSRRALYLLLVVLAFTFFPRQRTYSSTILARAPPVPQALLPIIQQSGNLLKKISPAAGLKVKEWHDQRKSLTPAGKRAKAERDAASLDHEFHPNGLLIVNPKGRHPVVVLIEAAEKRWKEKLDRQSKTLSEAVAEYKVRYRMNPPKGFDDW